jgi:hypothetical protein
VRGLAKVLCIRGIYIFLGYTYLNVGFMSELPSREELPEKPLRLKNIIITFILARPAYLEQEDVRKLLRVVGKGSLNYLLALAAKFRELMRKEIEIRAIGFPAVQSMTTKNALVEARKTLKKTVKNQRAKKLAKKLVDELLKIEEDKPLIIAREGPKPYLEIIHKDEQSDLVLSYLNSLPYLRVEGPLAEITFKSLLEIGKRNGALENTDVAELKELMSPNAKLFIKPMLRFHGGFPIFTLIATVAFPLELELEVHQVNTFTQKLPPVIYGVAINSFGKGFPDELKKVFKEVLGFKPMFKYTVGVSTVFASLEFDKSFEELVKTYPCQVAGLVTRVIGWWMLTPRDAKKDVEKSLVGLYTDTVILAGYQSVVLKRATTPLKPYEGLLNPVYLKAILAQDLAVTAKVISDGLIDSLRGREFNPRVLGELREHVIKLLSELGSYYRLAYGDPFRSIWRITYRVQELHRARGELKELLSAIDRGLKRVEERRFSFMSILLGTLGVFGALEFILGVFSLWGINTYTIVVAGVVALAITTLLSAIIYYMRK